VDILKFNLNRLMLSSRSRTLIIEGVHFELTPAKKYLAILGDSGIGKTTVFKSLFPVYLNIWKLDGTVELECEHEIDGQKITLQTILENKLDNVIGFATQVPYFFDERTVGENLFFPLKWKNLVWEDDQKKEYLANFELTELANAKMSELSGGERQLLNIARMLILKPRLAIIDECFSNMDERLSSKTIQIIQKKYQDTYFLFTSHRKTEIDLFNADTRLLIKQFFRSGKPYVTLHEASI
jgi:ABC-type multidrug transport system ATPase subunit